MYVLSRHCLFMGFICMYYYLIVESPVCWCLAAMLACLMWAFGLDLKWLISSFFFPLHMNSKITWFYCAGDKKHCSRTVYILFMSPTTLFTHLKIILLQCFQFSVFSFSNNKFNPNGPIYTYIGLELWCVSIPTSKYVITYLIFTR